MRPRSVTGRGVAAAIAVVTVFGAGAAVATPARASSSAATLTISGPARAPLGRNVSLRLFATSPRAVGAFQANLRFDGRALEVVRVTTPHTLPGSGALTPLSAVETPNRKVIAGWSCSGPGCGPTAAAVAAGQPVLLATIDVEALRSGPIELRIDGGLLVDTAGAAIANASARTAVTFGRGGSASPAPRTSAFGVAAAVAHTTHASLDVNGDGRVTPLDAGALTEDWLTGAASGASCPAPALGTDTNGDGCMNIADLQAVARGITAAPPAPSRLAVHNDPAVSYTVNSAGDGTDAKGDGICQTSTVGECTLRAALTEANRQSVPVSIAFNIPGTGVQTLTPATRLPALNNPNGITIDGFTQPGSSPNTDPIADNAVYTIELVGNGGNGINGLFVSQPNNVIRGLNLHNFQLAIALYGANASNNLIEGNLVGLTPSGAMDPNWTLINTSSCIVAQQGANNNQIGAPGVANRNVVSGCDHQDIATYDYPTNNTTIQNNIVGLDPTGTLRRPAKSHGIDINTGTRGTLIGGPDPGDRNVSSGNLQEGIEISHNPLTQHNSIIGNFIGTDLTGNNAFTYTEDGQWGVHLEGDPTCNNAACDLDMGYATVTNNVIVNAQRGGLLVDKGVHDSTISNNLIGVTANGTPAPNGLFGVNIQAGSVRITLGPGNTIANNENGVQMTSLGTEPPNSAPSVTNATITQNSIYGNGTDGGVSLGIDLTPWGQVNTAANADPDVNDAMIAPVLSDATTSSLTATTCASCTVELFVADQPAASFGSGRTYLQSATADTNGIATFTLPSTVDGDVVTATATNTNGSTSEFAKNVLIPGSQPNPPVAAFNYACNGLSCSFDGSSSTDAGGTIVSYNWTFGDTGTGNGALVQHGYTSPNTYTVKLTVTDDHGATAFTTQQVVVTDLPPTAAFTGSCTQLACSFDGSSSSDPDNAISSYSWDFGDTSPAGSGAMVNHTYAASGQYSVTLTVDDGQGGTNSVTHTFNVTAAAVVATDTFTRTVASGWGTADTGGAWSAAQGTTSGSTSVNGSAGAITLTTAAAGRGFILPSVSVLNSDSVVDVSTSVLPVGGTFGQVSYITARRVAANTEYRVRLRFATNNTVHLSFVKVVGNTTEVVIGSDVAVSGLTDAAGKVFHLRFDVSGTNPTTLQAKVWPTTATEPANWQLTATDSQAALQAAGAPGLRAFLGGSSTNTPTWLFDNFNVANLTPSTSNVAAADLFTRTVASGWGTADTGGAWSAAPGTTTGSTSVNGSAGAITLTTAAAGRGFILPSVSVLNSDAVVDVSTSVLPAGGTFGQETYVTARRVAANTEYRVRLRFATNNTVHLSFVKVVGNTTEVVIGSDVAVSGLTDAAAKVFRLRFDVTGTNPTTLKAKVWDPTSAEPATWQLTATDSQAVLQAAGAPGLRAYLGGSATNTPTWLFDNYTVTAL